MYNFEKPGQQSTINRALKTIFNKVNLDDVLTTEKWRFQTLVVNGRGILSENHLTTDVSGRNGSFYLNSTKKVRELTVKAMIYAVNDLEFRKLNEELNYLLGDSKISEIRFSDEPNRAYFGKFLESDNQDEISNSIIITLKFICYDPNKYSDEISYTGLSLNYLGKQMSYPIFKITLKNDVSELRLLHIEQQKYVRLNKSYKRGNIIEIDMNEHIIKVNGRNDLSSLDVVNSRFFGLLPGINNFDVNNHGLEIKYREVFQ